MNIKFWWISLAASVLFGTCLRAQWIVEDPVLINIATQQSMTLGQLEVALNQTNFWLKQIDDRVGSPGVATLRLENDHAFITYVGRMGNPESRLQTLEGQVDVRKALESQTNPYRKRIGGRMQVMGKDVPRERSAYDYNLKTESLVRKLRDNAEVNRMHQHEITSRLAGANDRFERAATIAELEASGADFQRLTALMMSASFVSENLDRDFKMRAELKALARQEQLIRRRETQFTRGHLKREANETERKARTGSDSAKLEQSSIEPWNVKVLTERRTTSEIN